MIFKEIKMDNVTNATTEPNPPIIQDPTEAALATRSSKVAPMEAQGFQLDHNVRIFHGMVRLITASPRPKNVEDVG